MTALVPSEKGKKNETPHYYYLSPEEHIHRVPPRKMKEDKNDGTYFENKEGEVRHA